MSFIPTDDQKRAIETISKFILKPVVNNDDYFQTLSGFAGTGKTTLIQEVIREFKYKKKIVVSGPTHRAKENIAKITNQTGETIQALLGLRPVIDIENFNPNKPIFDTKAEERIRNYDIVIIDEVSMLGKAAVRLIEDKAIQNKVKIIYIGDIYQTPPVKESLSLVFKLPNLIQLNEIIRQKDSNPNQKLIELARNDVRDQTDKTLPYLRSILMDMNKDEGFKYLNQEQYYETLLEKYYDSEYQQNPDIIKTICWSNDAVTKTNNYIRRKIIDSTEMIAVGDILTGYKTTIKEISVPPYKVPIIKNSIDYIVTKVIKIEKLICNRLITGYEVEVKDGRLPMFILHKDSYDVFKEEYTRRVEYANSTRQCKQFYAFKDNIFCMEKMFDDFGTLICDKDIDYGYAITVHKAQGGTYNNVGITLKDILNNPRKQERRSLIYVALSRTSGANFIYAD